MLKMAINPTNSTSSSDILPKKLEPSSSSSSTSSSVTSLEAAPVSEPFNKNSTLHEVASKHFKRTPKGLLFTKDIKDVYSLLLLCLDLTAKPFKKSKNLFSNLTQNNKYPYSFYLTDAIEVMKNLKITVDTHSTAMSILYSINEEFSYQLIKIFTKAKLLHSPADRTRSEPKEKVILQPTPKGVAILQKYVRDIGLKELPSIIYSNLNSMELFTFERSSLTDSIVYSQSFVQILFAKVFGPKPNYWSPSNPDDSLPTLLYLLSCTDDTFTFEDIRPSLLSIVGEQCDGINGDLNGQNNQNVKSNVHISTSKMSASVLKQPSSLSSETVSMDDATRVSPLTHRFFTNPNSDSHVQYYVSSCGLRLLRNLSTDNEHESANSNTKNDDGNGDGNITIDCAFSTKALWQWLMDCTDIIYTKEAISIASLFLKYGLIVPLHSLNGTKKRKFVISKNIYYTFSKLGWEKVNWAEQAYIENKNGVKVSYADQSGINGSNGGLAKCNIKNKNIGEHENIGLTGPLVDSSKKSQIANSGRNAGSDANINCIMKNISKNVNFVHKNLSTILSDPGLRYLFRVHLEKELCVENLDCYIEIKRFLNRMVQLEKLVDSRNKNKALRFQKQKMSLENITPSRLPSKKKKSQKPIKNILSETINAALVKQVNECLSIAYHIYSTYITIGAPHQLNLDYSLREGVTAVILHPNSPISTSNVTELQVLKDFTSTNSSPIRPKDPTKTSIFDIELKSLEKRQEKRELTKGNFFNSPKLSEQRKYDGTISLHIDEPPVAASSFLKNLCSTPTDSLVSNTLQVLQSLKPLYDEILEKVYKMMEFDSLPKFIESNSLKDSLPR
ncbi:related to Protein SST2 [Saccharomycodes ludwigii]|uniref:Related to Protein SST2 n=1 Tax=Saccharomycodes ludwigii TaxID=36035 RepID=A0A376B7L6_9ASCO|nr:hypothetical protein SCDLUD_000046 [Saccharomycodes ludwigii]KAH3902469.1 hypothetical protein SCDLUD_000046 [Saccharomycodes ludwigii]SSD60484.1 related to Protein SST2 [Saccharomycodes ludwigii]